MKILKKNIECRSCGGTGIYVGMGEQDGASIICRTCNGTGKEEFEFHYNEFTKRKKRKGIKRVYLDGMGYCIAPKKINFENIGEIDLSKEGISYEEFLNGKMPNHIYKLGCPMLADQGACHGIKGFVDKCEDLNGGWVGNISSCKNIKNKKECWDRFEKARKK